MKTITQQFNEAINHKYSIPGYVQGFCDFITRRIEDKHDKMLFQYDWCLKYLHQKAGVANAERHFIRIQTAEEKRKKQREKADAKEHSAVNLLNQAGLKGDRLRVRKTVVFLQQP